MVAVLGCCQSVLDRCVLCVGAPENNESDHDNDDKGQDGEQEEVSGYESCLAATDVEMQVFSEANPFPAVAPVKQADNDKIVEEVITKDPSKEDKTSKSGTSDKINGKNKKSDAKHKGKKAAAVRNAGSHLFGLSLCKGKHDKSDSEAETDVAKCKNKEEQAETALGPLSPRVSRSKVNAKETAAANKIRSPQRDSNLNKKTLSDKRRAQGEASAEAGKGKLSPEKPPQRYMEFPKSDPLFDADQAWKAEASVPPQEEESSALPTAPPLTDVEEEPEGDVVAAQLQMELPDSVKFSSQKLTKEEGDTEEALKDASVVVVSAGREWVCTAADRIKL